MRPSAGQIIALLFLLAGPSALLAQVQTYCDTPYEPEAEQFGGDGNCSNYWNYVPDVPSHFPIKTVRLMMHVMHQSVTDPLNFVPGDEYVLTDIVNDLNLKMATFQEVSPNPFGSPHIPDSRVSFAFDPNTDIQYYVNANAWARTGGYDGVYNTTVAVNPDLSTTQVNSYLHILVTGISSNNDGPCKIGGATYASIIPQYRPWIGFGSWWCASIGSNAGVYTDAISSITGNFRHELGHNLMGLYHIYGSSGDGCGDTEDCSNSSIYCGGGASNNLMDDWQTCQCAISACQLGKLHYRLENVPSVFSRLRPDHCTFDPAQTITINIGEDVFWTAKREMYGNLVVETGAKLTIQCQVSFPSGGKLIVKPGGKVTIEGSGKLTNICGQFWQGIEAWGTVSQHQYPASQPTYQGLVVLKKGAVVEHALLGFTNWKPGVKASRGGVLQVQGTLNETGGTFLNCRRAVEFKKYRNFHPNLPTLTQNNLSYFRHADFIVNPDYRGGDDFDHHVDLWDVTGIAFSQCDFINTQVSGPGGINESHKLGKGIYSLDATFSVNGQCAISLPLCEYGSGLPQPVCPEQHRRPSKFIGLDHDVHATSSGMAGRTFTVRDSEFENNVCGIYNDAVRGATILRNKFVLGGRDVELTGLDVNFIGRHRAVYSHHANAFRVEENDLFAATTPLVEVEGVVIGYTQAYNDQVYKNSSYGMFYGFVAEDRCVDMNDPVGTGLAFLCNENMQNQEEDFRVRSTWLTPPVPSDHSIKMFQGSASISAGNEFTQQNSSSPYYNYHNAAQALPITYFWEAPPGDLNTGAYNAPWVQRNANISTVAYGCPTRIICGGTILQVKSFLDPLIDQERLAYLNLKYVFESLLDGGDYEELKQTIMESWPQDAWELRNALMERSPYLSVQILKEAGLKNILPHAMYLEICLANPEATQRDGFIRWVQYDMPNPLPEYMVAQIVASWDQRTWRTSLESALGWHKAEYQRLNDQVISVMLNDSIPQPADSILVRWQLNPSLRARYGEVSTLLELERYTEAEALLNGLADNYRMHATDIQERDDMLGLIAVVRNAQVADRSIMELDGAEVSALEAIASHQPSIGATHARNILCFGYGICTPPITGETPQPKSQWSRPPGTDTAVPSVLTIHPNPASTWVAFSHTITGKVDRAFIRVRDAQGKEVHSAALATSPGQSIWDVRGFAAGTYAVELYNRGALVEAQRVVVRP